MSQRRAGTFLIPILLLFLAACGGGPRGPAKGSPEWLYQAAQEAFRIGEMEKTHQHLEKIQSLGNNPYQARATAWQLVMESGLLLGNQELGEAFGKGWGQAGPRKSSFMTEKMNSLKEARRHAIHLVEAYDRFVQTVSDSPVVLEFPFPKGSGAPISDLERINMGMWLPDEQRAQLHEKALDRGMVRGVSAAVTSMDDSAGAQSALKSGRTEAPPAKFLLAMGQSLWKTAPLFERRSLNEPDKIKHLQDRALDAAKRARQMKPEQAVETAAKKLQEDCEKALKARKG